MAKHCLVRALGMGISVLGGAMLLQSAAVAQEQQPTEKVIITGSAIPRTETETPAPVQVITAEEIQKSGATTLQDVLHNLTANGANNLQQGFAGAFAGGAAGVALRGMTVDATLVLIDGHRMAPYPISDDGQRSFVDVANLPLSIIDRIEVLKDSGSALYGSDAIAGVVNIITRKSYVGSQVSADYGESGHNDGITFHVTATHGWGDLAADGHNTYLNIEYRHQNEIGNAARSQFANYDYFHTFGPTAPTLPGIVQPGSAFPVTPNLFGMTLPISNPGTPGATVGTTATQLGGCKQDPLGGCGYNPANYFQIQPETENLNLWLKHSMQLTPDWQVTGSASIFKDQAQQLYTPRAVGTGVAWAAFPSGVTFNTGAPQAQPIVLPIGNVNNPYNGKNGQPLSQAWLNYVFGDVGATDTKFDTATYRIAVDLNGPVIGWDTSTSIGWIRGISDISYYGYPTYSGLLSVIAANDYYIGSQASKNTQAVYNILDPTTQAVATSQMQYVELNGNRDVPWFALPGGPMSVAVGVSLHHWGQDDPGQPGALTGQTIGLGTTFIHGTETDQAAHFELSAPVIKMLEIDGQVRFDKVIGTGSRISPRGSFKLTPIEQIALRGSYSRGFRAPGPGEKGNSGTTFFEGAPTDTIRCPVTHLPTDCGSAPGAGIFGAVTSNPGLSPEISEAYNLGVVLEPIKSVSVSVDWYKIARKDYIYNGPSSFIRGPVQAAFPTVPGPIIGVEGPYLNLGKDVTSGLEFDAQAKHEFDPLGTLGMRVTWTHLIYYDMCGVFPFSPTAGCLDIAGTHGPQVISGNTGTPKDRGNATFTIDRGPAQGGFNINYVSGYALSDPSLGFFGLGQPGGCFDTWIPSCHVSSFTDVDLFGHYDVTKSFQINGHILNIFDRDAPFDPQAQYDQNNYSVNWAQQGAVGRFFQVGLRYTF